MTSSLALKTALERLVSGTSNEDDRYAVREGLLAGQIVFGDRNVVIGGDAQGAVIITGDQTQVKLDLTDAVYERLRERLFPTPRGMPPPFPELIFIGRDKAVREVKELLMRVPAAVVRGWPGVGKTTLVSVLSRDSEVTQAFPDGVLWTSLDQKPSLVSLLAGWGRALGRDDLLRVPTAEEAAKLLSTVLTNKRMLLIVDDVWEAEHGAVFLQARADRCAMLVTTRLPTVAHALAQTEEAIYYLDVLTETDALKLMQVLAPDVVNEYAEECRLLVNDLERLPLRFT